MPAAPAPKPSLLASLGVRPDPHLQAEERTDSIESPAQAESADARANATAEPQQRDATAHAPPAPPRRSTAPKPAIQTRQASTHTRQPRTQPRDYGEMPAAAALDVIRERHRARRGSGAKPPLAPLNVDVPLELLQQIRSLSSDIPYPLRRLAEEALELWVVATADTRVTTNEQVTNDLASEVPSPGLDRR